MTSRVPLVSLEHARELGEAMGLPARRTQSEAFRVLANNPGVARVAYSQLIQLSGKTTSRSRTLQVLRLCRFGLRRLKIYFRRSCRRRGGTQKHEPTCAEWTNDGLHGDHEEVGHGLAAEVSPTNRASPPNCTAETRWLLRKKNLICAEIAGAIPRHLTNPKRMRN